MLASRFRRVLVDPLVHLVQTETKWRDELEREHGTRDIERHGDLVLLQPSAEAARDEYHALKESYPQAAQLRGAEIRWRDELEREHGTRDIERHGNLVLLQPSAEAARDEYHASQAAYLDWQLQHYGERIFAFL